MLPGKSPRAFRNQTRSKSLLGWVFLIASTPWRIGASVSLKLTQLKIKPRMTQGQLIKKIKYLFVYCKTLRYMHRRVIRSCGEKTGGGGTDGTGLFLVFQLSSGPSHHGLASNQRTEEKLSSFYQLTMLVCLYVGFILVSCLRFFKEKEWGHVNVMNMNKNNMAFGFFKKNLTSS